MSWRHGIPSSSCNTPSSSLTTSMTRTTTSCSASTSGNHEKGTGCQSSVNTTVPGNHVSRSAESKPSWVKPVISKRPQNFISPSGLSYRSTRENPPAYRDPPQGASTSRDVALATARGPLSPGQRSSGGFRSGLSATNFAKGPASPQPSISSRPHFGVSTRILSPPRTARQSTVSALAKAFENKSQSASPLRSAYSRGFGDFSPSPSRYSSDIGARRPSASKELFSPKSVPSGRDAFSPSRDRQCFSPTSASTSRDPFSPSRSIVDSHARRYLPSSAPKPGTSSSFDQRKAPSAGGQGRSVTPIRESVETSSFQSPTRREHYRDSATFSSSFFAARNTSTDKTRKANKPAGSQRSPGRQRRISPNQAQQLKSGKSNEFRVQSSPSMPLSKTTSGLIEEANKGFNELADKISAQLSSERQSLKPGVAQNVPSSQKRAGLENDGTIMSSLRTGSNQNLQRRRISGDIGKSKSTRASGSIAQRKKAADSDGYDSSSSEGRFHSSRSPPSRRSDTRRKTKSVRVRQNGSFVEDASINAIHTKMSNRGGKTERDMDSSSDDGKELGSFDSRLRARRRRLQKSRNVLQRQEPLVQPTTKESEPVSKPSTANGYRQTAALKITGGWPPGKPVEEFKKPMGRTNPLTGKPSRFLKPKDTTEELPAEPKKTSILSFPKPKGAKGLDEGADLPDIESKLIPEDELLLLNSLPILDKGKSNAPQKLSLNYIEYWNQVAQEREKRGASLVKRLIAAAEAGDAGAVTKAKDELSHDTLKDSTSTDKQKDSTDPSLSSKKQMEITNIGSPVTVAKTPTSPVHNDSPTIENQPIRHTEKVLLTALYKAERKISPVPDKPIPTSPPPYSPSRTEYCTAYTSPTITQAFSEVSLDKSAFPTTNASFLEKCQQKKRQREEEAIKKSSLQTVDLLPKPFVVSAEPVSPQPDAEPVQPMSFQGTFPKPRTETSTEKMPRTPSPAKVVESKPIAPPLVGPANQVTTRPSSSLVTSPQPTKAAMTGKPARDGQRDVATSQQKHSGGPVPLRESVNLLPVLAKDVPRHEHREPNTKVALPLQSPSVSQTDENEISSTGQLQAIISSAKDFLNSFLLPEDKVTDLKTDIDLMPTSGTQKGGPLKPMNAAETVKMPPPSSSTVDKFGRTKSATRKAVDGATSSGKSRIIYSQTKITETPSNLKEGTSSQSGKTLQRQMSRSGSLEKEKDKPTATKGKSHPTKNKPIDKTQATPAPTSRSEADTVAGHSDKKGRQVPQLADAFRAIKAKNAKIIVPTKAKSSDQSAASKKKTNKAQEGLDKLTRSISLTKIVIPQRRLGSDQAGLSKSSTTVTKQTKADVTTSHDRKSKLKDVKLSRSEEIVSETKRKVLNSAGKRISRIMAVSPGKKPENERTSRIIVTPAAEQKPKVKPSRPRGSGRTTTDNISTAAPILKEATMEPKATTSNVQSLSEREEPVIQDACYSPSEPISLVPQSFISTAKDIIYSFLSNEPCELDTPHPIDRHKNVNDTANVQSKTQHTSIETTPVDKDYPSGLTTSVGESKDMSTTARVKIPETTGFQKTFKEAQQPKGATSELLSGSQAVRPKVASIFDDTTKSRSQSRASPVPNTMRPVLVTTSPTSQQGMLNSRTQPPTEHQTVELPPPKVMHAQLPQRTHVTVSKVQKRGDDSPATGQFVSPITGKPVAHPRVDIKKVDQELLNLLSLGQELETQHRERRQMQQIAPPPAPLSKAQSMILTQPKAQIALHSSITDLRADRPQNSAQYPVPSLAPSSDPRTFLERKLAEKLAKDRLREQRERSQYDSRESLSSVQSIPQAPVFAKTMQPKPRMTPDIRPSSSASNLTSNRQSPLDTAEQKIDELIYGPKQRGKMFRKPSQAGVRQLDAVYESLSQECNRLDQQPVSISKQATYTRKSAERPIIPSQVPQPPQRWSSVERFRHISRSNSLTPGQPQTQPCTLPSSESYHSEKYDFTKKWLEGESLTGEPKPDLLDFGPRPELLEDENSSVGSASIEVDAIMSRPRRSRYAPDLLSHKIEKPKPKQAPRQDPRNVKVDLHSSHTDTKLPLYPTSVHSIDTTKCIASNSGEFHGSYDSRPQPSTDKTMPSSQTLGSETTKPVRGHVRKKVETFERLEHVSGESSDRNSSCDSRRSHSLSDHMSGFIQKFQSPGQASATAQSDVEGWQPAPFARSGRTAWRTQHGGSVRSLPVVSRKLPPGHLGIYHVQVPPKQVLPSKTTAAADIESSSSISYVRPRFDVGRDRDLHKLHGSGSTLTDAKINQRTGPHIERQGDSQQLLNLDPIQAVDNLVAELELNTEDTGGTKPRFPISAGGSDATTAIVPSNRANISSRQTTGATDRSGGRTASKHRPSGTQNESYDNAVTPSYSTTKPVALVAPYNASYREPSKENTAITSHNQEPVKESAFQDIFNTLDKMTAGDLSGVPSYKQLAKSRVTDISRQIPNLECNNPTKLSVPDQGDLCDQGSVASCPVTGKPNATVGHRSASDVTSQSTSQVMNQVVAALATLDDVAISTNGYHDPVIEHDKFSTNKQGIPGVAIKPSILGVIDERSDNSSSQNSNPKVAPRLNQRPLSLDLPSAIHNSRSGERTTSALRHKGIAKHSSVIENDYDNLEPPLPPTGYVTKSMSGTSIRSDPLLHHEGSPSSPKQPRQSIVGFFKRIAGSQSMTKPPSQSQIEPDIQKTGNSSHSSSNPNSSINPKYPAKVSLHRTASAGTEYSTPPSMQSSADSAQLEAWLMDETQPIRRESKSLHDLLPMESVVGLQEPVCDKSSKRLRFPWIYQKKQAAK